MLVTISGLPGSGTTTTARLVSRALGLEQVHGGEVWRRMGADRAMTVAEFSRYSEQHPEIDVELDRRLADRARAGGCVLESRLAGWIATVEGLDAIRVWVRCEEGERAGRVAEREGIAIADALAQNRAREKSERRRYQDVYGIDLADLSIYDLVVDSGAEGPAPLAEAVVAAALDRFGGRSGDG